MPIPNDLPDRSDQAQAEAPQNCVARLRYKFNKFKEELVLSETLGPLLRSKFKKELRESAERWSLIAIKCQLVTHLLLQLMFIK